MGIESGAETAGANIFSHLPFSYFRPKHIVLYFSSLIIPFQFKIFSADERLAEYINTRPDAEFDGVFPE